MGTGTCKDFICFKEFPRKFLGRSSHTDELSLDICLTTNLEFLELEFIRNQWEFGINVEQWRCAAGVVGVAH